MSEVLAAALASLAVGVLVGWALPWIAMRMLVPSLEASRRTVSNYRGAAVATGLGVVWIVWAVLVIAAALKVAFMGAMLSSLDASAWAWWVAPAILVVAAFAFGLIDDAYGAADAKGFRGHIGAMLHGRLTTGGLKLVGIGLVALMSAFFATTRESVSGPAWHMPVAVVLGTLVIALSANLVNLMDLRPGRALKTYIVLAAIALPVFASAAFTAVYQENPVPGWPAIAVAVPLLFGPALAVWRFDLGERAMLGDAGANAMGALVGYVFAASLPLVGLAVAAILLLGLNLLSEKVSFSKVIEANAALRWLDGLGRQKAPATAASAEWEQADGGSAALSDDNGEADTGKDGAE